MEPAIYASFLVRLWRERQDGELGDWCGEIEHIQSGVCWQCNTLAAVFQLLQRAAEGPIGIVPDSDADRET